MLRLPLLHVVIRSDVLRSNTFYNPTLGPKYVSKRPYNEFITLTAFILPMIGIFNGFPFPIFDVGYMPWTQCMPSRGVNGATRLAEASWRRDK